MTASGDAVVTLVVTPDEITEGGTSTVSCDARICGVEPLLRVGGCGSGRRQRPADTTVSPNKTLFFAEGATSSSGAPVTITSSNDNAYTGDQTLTVTGTITPPDDDMTVEDPLKLTVTDNDVAYGKIRLVLTPSRIDESDADDDADVNTAQSVVTADAGRRRNVRRARHDCGVCNDIADAITANANEDGLVPLESQTILAGQCDAPQSLPMVEEQDRHRR